MKRLRLFKVAIVGVVICSMLSSYSYAELGYNTYQNENVKSISPVLKKGFTKPTLSTTNVPGTSTDQTPQWMKDLGITPEEVQKYYAAHPNQMWLGGSAFFDESTGTYKLPSDFWKSIGETPTPLIGIKPLYNPQYIPFTDPEITGKVIDYVAGLTGINKESLKVKEAVRVEDGLLGVSKIIVTLVDSNGNEYKVNGSQVVYPGAEWVFTLENTSVPDWGKMDPVEAAKKLATMDPVEAATVLKNLIGPYYANVNIAAAIVAKMDPAKAAGVLAAMNQFDAAVILGNSNISVDAAVNIFSNMNADTAAAILQDCDVAVTVLANVLYPNPPQGGGAQALSYQKAADILSAVVKLNCVIVAAKIIASDSLSVSAAAQILSKMDPEVAGKILRDDSLIPTSVTNVYPGGGISIPAEAMAKYRAKAADILETMDPAKAAEVFANISSYPCNKQILELMDPNKAAQLLVNLEVINHKQGADFFLSQMDPTKAAAIIASDKMSVETAVKILTEVKNSDEQKLNSILTELDKINPAKADKIRESLAGEQNTETPVETAIRIYKEKMSAIKAKMAEAKTNFQKEFEAAKQLNGKARQETMIAAVKKYNDIMKELNKEELAAKTELQNGLKTARATALEGLKDAIATFQSGWNQASKTYYAEIKAASELKGQAKLDAMKAAREKFFAVRQTLIDQLKIAIKDYIKNITVPRLE